MKDEKVLFIDGEYGIPTQGDITLNQAIEDLSKAVANLDFFEATKKLSIIEMFKTPDLPYFTGMVYQAKMDFEKVIECFSQVPAESCWYSLAMSGLATAYMATGKYLLLDELLMKHCVEITPIHELQERLNCLEIMDIDDCIASYGQILTTTSSMVERFPDNKEGQEANYHVCRMLADMLVIAGECMNQCRIYKKNKPNSGYDFESYLETALFAKMYKKCVLILRFSKYIKYIRFTSDIDSLAIVALEDKTWEDRLKIFGGPDYIPQIAKIVIELCRPEHHPAMDAYICLNSIMERFLRMAPRFIDGIIDKYFDIISRAAINGEESAKDYLGLSYSRIVVTGKDPYKIKDRLEDFKNKNPWFSFDDILARTGLTYKMSTKGHDALLNAEHTFDVATKGNYGNRDASGLALGFFRVLEIEYNNKLIGPFSKALDFNAIHSITGFIKLTRRNSNGLFYNIDHKYSRWGKDLESLYDLQSGMKVSMEIATIRKLLDHILKWGDSCEQYLRRELEKHLTPEGKNAFYTADMINVIESAKVEKYRNPGAHTGFVPYSGACDARKFVRAELPRIESWFLNQK